MALQVLVESRCLARLMVAFCEVGCVARGTGIEAGSEFEIATDMVVFAIGTNANPILGQTSKLKLDKRGYIATDEALATSIAGVFAGGDIVTGAATVIEAMGAGRRAARGMKAWLGLRDTAAVCTTDGDAAPARRFGIDRDEHNYARVRVA